MGTLARTGAGKWLRYWLEILNSGSRILNLNCYISVFLLLKVKVNGFGSDVVSLKVRNTVVNELT